MSITRTIADWFKSRRKFEPAEVELLKKAPPAQHPGFSAQFATVQNGMMFSMSRRAVQNCRRIVALRENKSGLAFA